MNVLATIAACVLVQLVARLFQHRGLFNSIPGPPYEFLSTRGRYFASVDVAKKLAARYGKVWKVWTSFWDAEVVVSDPELVDVVLHNFQDFEIGPRDRLRSLTGNSLLTLRGEPWKAERKALNPAFHSKQLQCMCGIVDKTTTQLLLKCKKLVQSPEPVVEIGNLFRQCTLEVICQAAFGVEINFQDNSTAHPLGVLLNAMFENRQTHNTYQSKAKAALSGEVLKSLKMVKDIRTEVGRLVALRQTQLTEAEGKEEKASLLSKDLLGLMLAKKEEGVMTDQAIADEAIAFLIAGHETTSTWLMWTLYMLTQAPLVEEQLIEELNKVIVDGVYSWDVINKCEYLNLVLKESLRMYSPVPFLLRRTTRNLQLGQHYLPKGTMINIAPILLHSNHEVWDEPDRINPDRFLTKPADGTFVPFSEGSRSCIGQYFATMEAKIILARLLKDFKFSLVEGQTLAQKAGVTLYVAEGIHMKIEAR